MTTEDVTELRRQLADLSSSVAIIEGLQREANGRLGKIEGRVFEIEMWRARLQGAAATSRVVWLLAGGAVTGIILSIVNNN